VCRQGHEQHHPWREEHRAQHGPEQGQKYRQRRVAGVC
jgi:hypothetical protein